MKKVVVVVAAAAKIVAGAIEEAEDVAAEIAAEDVAAEIAEAIVAAAGMIGRIAPNTKNGRKSPWLRAKKMPSTTRFLHQLQGSQPRREILLAMSLSTKTP